MVIAEQFLTLSEAIADGDDDLGLEEAQKLIDGGVNPLAIFTDCVEPTLNDLGEQFARLDIFLPDLIMAGEVVKGLQAMLLPIMKANNETSAQKGKAVIATVYGDLHDIGKNMVSLMMEINGFEMCNMGEDVSPLAIVKKAEEINADLVCLSGLMLPSLPYMRETIEQVKSSKILSGHTKVMVGGGPVTSEWASTHGADGYSNDAMGAVRLAHELMNIPMR